MGLRSLGCGSLTMFLISSMVNFSAYSPSLEEHLEGERERARTQARGGDEEVGGGGKGV